MGRINVADVEALALIARLPDDTPLTTEEAAVFIRRSKSFLEKARRPESKSPGPRYSQGGSTRSEGANQKVVYFKGALKEWLEQSSQENTLMAAVGKGQMREMEEGDFDETAAYWLTPDGGVDSLVAETDVDVFFERLGQAKIEWLLPAEAVFFTERGLRVISEG